MAKYYTRGEICKMFNPPVSRHYLRTLQSKGRIPLPVKKRLTVSFMKKNKSMSGYQKELKKKNQEGKQGLDKSECQMKILTLGT